MTAEKQMFCKHCWNRVERIKYKEEGVRTPGSVENVWKHSAFSTHPCSINPITDDDVMLESEM
jgi:hypothetical protein